MGPATNPNYISYLRQDLEDHRLFAKRCSRAATIELAYTGIAGALAIGGLIVGDPVGVAIGISGVVIGIKTREQDVQLVRTEHAAATRCAQRLIQLEQNA